MTTKADVTRGFDLLNLRGYVAREDWACCQSCGIGEIEDELDESDLGFVFYHLQDAEAFEDDVLQDDMYIVWCGDGREIVNILTESGLRVEWNGDQDTRIKILH